MSLIDAPHERFTCSRAGCDRRAEWRLRWRNPKIHSADRVKVWLACDDHVGYLHDFLAARSFPIVVDGELDAPADPIGDGETDAGAGPGAAS